MGLMSPTLTASVGQEGCGRTEMQFKPQIATQV